MLMVDQRGKILLVNSETEKHFGYKREELTGQSVEILVPERFRGEHPEHRTEFFSDPRARPMGAGRDLYGRRKDGSEFPVEIGLNPVKTPDGYLVLSSIVDITERKRAVEKLIEQESLAKLGEVSAMVAHEVKNPLAGILGAMEMLKRRLSEGSFEHEICDEVRNRVNALNDTVKDILAFAHPKVPRPQPVPVRILLEDTFSLASSDPQFRDVDLSISGPDVTVPCDVEMMKRVFLNFLVNGAQAMGDKGKLSVGVKKRDDCCEISFRDTGPGISAEARERIFEPFFTTKAGGAGLGLPIAKRIVELHGGEISVDCPEPGGTEFSVRLPLSRAAEECEPRV